MCQQILPLGHPVTAHAASLALRPMTVCAGNRTPLDECSAGRSRPLSGQAPAARHWFAGRTCSPGNDAARIDVKKIEPKSGTSHHGGHGAHGVVGTYRY